MVGKKSVAQVAIWKQHGLPNSKSKKVLVAWHKGYIAQRASRTKYKLSNVEIGKLLRLSKKGGLKETLANKVSRLRKLGLPDTKDFKEVTYWYENFLLTTKDGRTVVGFLVEQDNRTVVLRGLDGQDISLERKDIKTMKAQGVSLMPAGLLTGYTDDQIRDLMAYLRSTQPLNN